MELLSTADETFAMGAQAGVSEILKFLVHDMEFEDGYVCEVSRNFDANPKQWGSFPPKNDAR
jgi:hypothetical protein